MSIRSLAVVAVVALLASPAVSADVTRTVVDVPSTNGVTQRILFVRPDNPTATIVAMPGGDGTLGIADGGLITSDTGRCFPFARTANALAAGGIAVALVDAASDRSIYRVANVAAAVRYAEQQVGGPVWVAGGSSSTNPVSAVVNALAPGEHIGAIYFSPDVPDVATASVRRPALVLYNPADAAQSAASFFAALTNSPTKQLVQLSGGVGTGCGFHLFQGQEAALEDTIAAFIGANNGATVMASLDLNQHGFTGSWFQPSTNGQGVELEVFEDLVAPGTGLLQGSWFTYDHAASGAGDHNRWYTFGGNVRAADTALSLPLYLNVGGNFDALPITSATQVGTVGLAFIDCSNATMSYAFTDGSARSGSIALTRLTPNVTCTTGAPVPANADFALSGNWFDATTAGQGFVVDVNPLANALFLTWYTYAVGGQAQGAAGQRWFTGQATYTAGARTIALTLSETTGGLFDRASPTPTTATVGTGTLTFDGCNAAHLAFGFTAGSNAGQSGTIHLTRVGPVPAGCNG